MLRLKEYKEVYDHLYEFPELKKVLLAFLPEEVDLRNTFSEEIGGDIYIVETPLDILTVPGLGIDTRMVSDREDYDATYLFQTECEPVFGAMFVANNNNGGDVYLFPFYLLVPYQVGLQNIMCDNLETFEI